MLYSQVFARLMSVYNCCNTNCADMTIALSLAMIQSLTISACAGILAGIA